MISGNQALNIGALFTQVFGISSPIYLPWGRDLGIIIREITRE